MSGSASPRDPAPSPDGPGIDIIFRRSKIRLKVTFNPGLPVILLGREDFFAHYRVAFDQRENVMTLEPY